MRRVIDKRDLTVSRGELLINGSDDAFRAMVHNLLAFAARLEQIRSRFGSFVGLSGVQYTILISIHHLQGDDGVGVKAIAEHLAFSSPFVTNETTKLVKLGLVDKRANPADLRRVRLKVSEKGAELLRQLVPVQQEINDVLFEPITAENYAAVRALARNLRGSAEKASLLSEYLIGSERNEA